MFVLFILYSTVFLYLSILSPFLFPLQLFLSLFYSLKLNSKHAHKAMREGASMNYQNVNFQFMFLTFLFLFTFEHFLFLLSPFIFCPSLFIVHRECIINIYTCITCINNVHVLRRAILIGYAIIYCCIFQN